METKKKKPKKVRLSKEAKSKAIWSEAETTNGVPISAEEILIDLRSEIIDISKKIKKMHKKNKSHFLNSKLFHSTGDYILIEVLCNYFQVAKQLGFVPSLSEYYDHGKFGIHNFPEAMYVDRGAVVKKIWGLDLQDYVFDIWDFWNQHISEMQMQLAEEKDEDEKATVSNTLVDVLEEAKKIIKRHKSRTRTADINIELMEEMIVAYQELGSLKALELKIGVPNLRGSFRHLVRVPSELRELVNNGKLISDPILATDIAIHATDCFNWDQEESKIQDVISLAKDIAKTFKENLDLRREYFLTKDDYSKPVTSSKTSELKEIFEDWPVKESKYPWKQGDRTQKQYRFIVFYSKVIGAVRFVRRWEYEKGRRISNALASQMIDEIKQNGNVKEFLQEHQNEFND